MRLSVSARLGASALGLWCATAQASVVAIIDSGLDYQHRDLKEKVWTNPGDSRADGIDDDQNGFKDDVHGWNFTANDGEVIDYRYAGVFNPEIARFFELQGKGLLGTATAEELDWMREQAKDRAFLKKLMVYGNYAHGTHVAGIATAAAPQARALAVKLIPTENPLASLTHQVSRAAFEGKEVHWIIKQVIKVGLSLVAKAQSQMFGQVGSYVALHKVDVANASLGIGPSQAKALLQPLLRLASGGQEVGQESLDELVKYFLEALNREQLTIARKAPETLFVFAAGNDGSSNDLFPTAPASMDHPNVISVAATYADGRLAPFSNYGERVSVAAPGVAVESATPNDQRIALSGTSQAAPYVAAVAARIKDLNPTLTAPEIKRLILGTVDRLPALVGKVQSAGIVNPERARVAAELSRDKPLATAIAWANEQVAASYQEREPVAPSEAVVLGPLPMPSPL